MELCHFYNWLQENDLWEGSPLNLQYGMDDSIQVEGSAEQHTKQVREYHDESVTTGGMGMSAAKPVRVYPDAVWLHEVLGLLPHQSQKTFHLDSGDTPISPVRPVKVFYDASVTTGRVGGGIQNLSNPD